MLPLHISLEKKKVVIAGGGSIALRRLKTVISEGVDITLVSPDVEPKSSKWQKSGVSNGKNGQLKKKIISMLSSLLLRRIMRQ